MDHSNRGRHRYTPYDGRGGRHHRNNQNRGFDEGRGPRSNHNAQGRNPPQNNSFPSDNNSSFDASSIGDWMSDNYYDEPPPRGYDPSDDTWGQDQIQGKDQHHDVHDKPPHHAGGAVDARVALERPCRTLFIRNIQYNMTEDNLRAKFEQYGEIKTFFSLIEKRGMLFVTYFDIRAAEQAKLAMQNTDLNGRKIDVHYSLPKEEERKAKCDADKNQGTLLFSLVGTNHHIDNAELTQYLTRYGDVKSVRASPLHGRYNNGTVDPVKSQRFVEFFDSRACIDCHDYLNGQEYQGGTVDLQFLWDAPVKDRKESIPKRDFPEPRGRREAGGYGRQGPGPSEPRAGGRQNYGHDRPYGRDDHYGSNRRDDMGGYDRNNDRRQGGRPPNNMRPIPSGPRDYNTNYGRPPPPSQPYSQQMYNPEAPHTGHYNGNQMRPPMSGPPPNAPAGGGYTGRPQAPANATPMSPESNRLEQAQKAQQLLSMIASAQGQQQPPPQQPVAPVYQPQPNASMGGQAQPAQVQQLLSMLTQAVNQQQAAAPPPMAQQSAAAVLQANPALQQLAQFLQNPALQQPPAQQHPSQSPQNMSQQQQPAHQHQNIPPYNPYSRQ
ncbi:hypothetical protein INT44_004011 [Umbelopsis vinacea]|uniref:RRM domain-containing protein n=1 Tax=Umbelopsis vinacea TaxID=44442 RepID=A0A8H7UK20_9FUNG|nr:hypothetical protein INT44_004011 [Umbelopsis vinacea]